MLAALRALFMRWLIGSSPDRSQANEGNALDSVCNDAADGDMNPNAIHTDGRAVADPVPYDEDLLEKSRTQWQFGDWESLVKLERDILQHHPDRAKLALLAAAGNLQTSHSSTARQLVRLAQDWGCNKKLISRILIAGVHNSLGRIAAVADQPPRALKHFESAIAVGMPNSDLSLIAQARAEQQLAQLSGFGLSSSALALKSSRSERQADFTNADGRLPSDSLKETIDTSSLHTISQSETSVANICRSKSLCLSRLEPGHDGWTREFSQGQIICEADGQDFVTTIRVKAGRDYLSRNIDLIPDQEYILSIECAGLSGNALDVLTVLSPEPLEGNTTLNSNSIQGSGRYTIIFKTGQKPISAKVRVGVGVTAPCESAVEIHLKHLNIAVQKSNTNNPSLLGEHLFEYLDPELVLPPLVGIGNDYGFIDEKRNQLIATAGWEKLTLSVIIPVSGHLDSLSKTLASVCVQTYPKKLIEVILVDNGIQEDLGDVFLQYADKLNLYWTKFKQAHKDSLASIRNLGVRASRNDILCFLEHGILLPKTFIENLMAYHHVEKNVFIFGAQHVVSGKELTQEKILADPSCLETSRLKSPDNPSSQTFADEIDESYDWRHSFFKKSEWFKRTDRPFIFSDGGVSSVSHEAFMTAGGVDETFENREDEDIEFAYRLMMNGLYFIPLREVSYCYFNESRSIHVHTKKVVKNKIENTQLQEKCPHFSTRKYEPGRQYDIPQISVYVPAFNMGKYIRQAIQSVLDQTYTDYEVVVVDDGSTDNTWDLLNDNFSNNSRIRLYRKKNGGIGSASNYALNHCRGYLVIQLDSDDLLTPNALEVAAEFFSKNPEIDCIYSKFDFIDESGAFYKSGWAPPNFDRYEALVEMNVPHMRCFKRSIYSRNGGFDESIENAVDYDFYLKASKIARIAHLNQVLYLRRVHDSHASSIKRALQAKNHIYVVNKFLHSLGMNDFIAEKLDPTKLHKNYVYRKGGFFAKTVEGKIFTQSELPEGIDLSVPHVVGNDYTYIENYVREYYNNNPAKYSQKVSVVIPVYNRAECLARCLAGLSHQTYPRELMELVVVDGGSSDDVLDVIIKYQKYFDLRYVKKADDGYRLSAARNLGIRSASHQNISIVDCNLIPLPNFIEAFMQYLHHFDNVVLLGHQRFIDLTSVSDDDILADVGVLSTFQDIVAENTTMTVVENEEGPFRDWRYSLYEQSNYLKNYEFPYRALSSGHVAYRRKAIERAGYYDEEFNVWGCEDNEAGYRLYNQGYIFIPVLEAIDLHQGSPEGRGETDREKDRLISHELLQAKCPALRTWIGKTYERKPGDAPLISICIPVFNTKEYIVEAIESALAQTIKDIEVVIYDDGSTDGTYELIKTKYCDQPTVKILKGTERRNVTFARDKLIKSARGEFVGFLDSDDVLEPTCIEECLKEFRGKPNIGLVCTGYKRIGEQGELLDDGWTPMNFTREGMFFSNIFTHFRMFRIRDWNRSAKWSTEELASIIYGEDWDLCLKLAEVTEFTRISKTLYRYRIRSSSITRTNRNELLSDQVVAVARAMLKRRGINRVGVGSSYPQSNPHLICYYSLSN